jgi:hypothetical protein
MKPHASSKVLFTQLPGGDEAVEKLPGSPFLTTVRALRTLLLDVLSPIRDRRYLRPRLFHEVGGYGYLVIVFSETQRARLIVPAGGHIPYSLEPRDLKMHYIPWLL